MSIFETQEKSISHKIFLQKGELVTSVHKTNIVDSACSIFFFNLTKSFGKPSAVHCAFTYRLKNNILYHNDT